MSEELNIWDLNIISIQQLPAGDIDLLRMAHTGTESGSYADCRRADSYCIRLLCYYRKKQTAKTGTEAQTGK